MTCRSPLHLALATLALTSLLQAAEPPAPFGAVPHERQLQWQRLEYYAFVHLGLNTYTDREWGYGDEDPSLFNPQAFDALTIVRHFKDAGMKGMILTAKHHDGFCLWPTKTTAHNISKSPWKNGKGDLIQEFASACRAEGLKLGIYVSPWDRNHAAYGRDQYVRDFHEQIREVLTHYGPIFEIWFDGANGGDGFYGGARESRSIPADYYQFPEAVKMIRQLQPECVVWSAGDARWGGSEQGHVAYPHWHTMDTLSKGDHATGVRHGPLWIPAEGDTSIRHGWFWHEREDSQVKSPDKLMQVWFDCVGRGANFILNVPPDRDGKIRQPDIDSLTRFRQTREALYAKDFAQGAKAEGPARGGDETYGADKLTDHDIESYWAAEDDHHTPTAEIQLASPTTFDVIRLREQIRLGQRVDAYEIDAWIDGDWTKIHSGKTIGNQVLVKLASSYTSERVRLRITDSAAVPCISELALYRMPVVLSAPQIVRGANDKVSITIKGSGQIRYSLDGSEPTADSPLYVEPFDFPLGGTVKARVVDAERLGNLALRTLTCSKARWKIRSATAGHAAHAIDDNPQTFWHTHPVEGERNPPQSFEVDLGSDLTIAAFTYLPRQDGVAHGMTDRYRIELSRDGKRWVQIAAGEFSNIKANPIEQTLSLKSPVSARYFRFTGLHAVEKNHVSAAEIGVIVAP
jgi:alpha-L-fucosidase